MNALADLQEYLVDGEEVEAIVFGPWGWGSEPRYTDQPWDLGYGEPDPPAVPFDLRGKVLTLEEAEPFMSGWVFSGGYGSPECYAVYIWTTDRVIWVTQYDGATGLESAPRNPTDTMPDMPGG